MYVLFVVLVAAAMAVALWLDNQILPGAVSYWWLLLVAAYLLTALDVSLRNLKYIDRLVLVGTGISMIIFAVLFGRLLTVYLSAAVLITISLSAWHREPGRGKMFSKVAMLAALCIAAALLIQPMTINRVEVRLPNLSAGTTLTLLTTSDRRDSLDAQFVNRKDDHFELNVYLGAQILPASAAPPPRLRIAIERERIVVRILSLRYQSRIAFFDVTLGEWSGGDLKRLIALNPDSQATIAMEGERLLISDLRVDAPLILTLPATDQSQISTEVWLLSVSIRLLLFGLLIYAATVWMPRSGRKAAETLT